MIGPKLSIFLIVFFFLVCTQVVTGAVTLYVGADQTYTSIQEAINSADPGDTIEVGPGLYDERIVINKAITLRGATAGVSKKGYVVPANYHYNNETESIIAPQDTENAPVVTIEKGDVTFDGFIVSMTVAGSYPSYAPTELVRMTAGGNLNNVRIENNVIGPNTNMTLQGGNAGRMGITVSKWSPGTGDNTVYNLQIRNNMIFDAKGDGCGILMIGARNTSPQSLQNQFKGAVIDNNEITGNHRSGIDFSGGVQGGANPADHIRITNNIISNNGWNSTVDRDNIKWGNGIAFLRMTDQLNERTPWGPRYIDIENNEITGNEKNGVYFGPIVSDITLHGNTITGNGAGTSGDGTTTGYNTSWDGIRIDLDETYQVEELARHPEQGMYNGQKIHDYLADIIIDENAISGNGGYGLNIIRTPLHGPLDARYNWWGAGSGPENGLSNPAGTGDAVSVNARYVPWVLGDMGTSVSPAGGAGPILVVGGGNFSSIQAAINAASAGDAIKVKPGTYNERIVINKSVTLLGATNGVSKKDYQVPEGYAYDETTESIIQPLWDEDNEVVDITAGNVIFDGFIVANTVAEYYAGYSLTHLIGLSNRYADYNDVIIQNNVLGPNTNAVTQNGKKGRAAIAVYGQWPNTVYNFTISRNKIFNAEGDGCGIMLLGAYNGTTPGTTGKYRGAIIDNNTISGNHRSGIEFAGGVQGIADPSGHFRITGNNITNNGWRDDKDEKKDDLKYGNGIALIRTGSDAKSNYNPLAWGSRYVDIDNNQILNNEKNGIYLGAFNKDISIKNNSIIENGGGKPGKKWDGIQVDLTEEYHKPPQIDQTVLTGIVIARNSITGSGDYGLQVIGTPLAGPVDARLNWWGDTSGPKGPANPSAKGERVSAGAAVSPWYKNPALTETSTGIPQPIVSFDWSPFDVMADEDIAFDASATLQMSQTAIQSYEWKFGDGNVTTTTVPLISHAYAKAKVYKVTLSVTDMNGATNATSNHVTVIGKRASIPVSFNGTTTTGGQGNQKIVVNITSSDGEVTNTTTELSVTNPGNGWAQMIVKGNTSSGDGSIVVENITEVVLKAAPTVTILDTSAGGVGEVTTMLELSLKEFVEVPLQIEVTEGANATVANAFQLAAGSGNTVDAVAYTMTIRGSSLINSNLSASGEPVKLNMSVSREWVDAHGGIAAINVIRYSDDGNTREVLETNYLFTAGTPAMCYFEIISPNGCSIFGIAAISAVPQASAPAAYPYAPAGEYSNGGADSDSSSPAPKKTPTPIVTTLPLTPAPPAPQPTGTPGTSVRRSRGLHLKPAGIPVYDDVITIIMKSNGDPKAIIQTIIAFVVSNIIAITGVVVLSVAAAYAIIWYGDRKRYWL